MLGSLENVLQDAFAGPGPKSEEATADVVFWTMRPQKPIINWPIWADRGTGVDARWAGTLIEGAVAALKTEMRKQVSATVDELLGFVGGEETSYSEVAQRIGLTVATTKAAIYRLRERYRAFLHAEVARTVSSSADFDDEIHDLRNSLMSRRPKH